MMKPNSAVCMGRAVLLCFMMGIFICPVPWAKAGEAAGSSIETEWDGHARLFSRVMFPRSGTIFEQAGLDPNYDGAAQVRLNNQTFFSDRVYTQVQWEGALAGGGTRRDSGPLDLFSPPDDDRRLFDLTCVIHSDEDSFSYHRLDRAMVGITPQWGEMRLGRQAVTWGHGFSFNPMDLFNPFAPTNLERDYKMGDDMMLARFPFRDMDVELLYVVRRDPDTGHTDPDENSLGTKLHFGAGDLEVELVAARHFEDYVAGAGIVGELGGAAWRFDITGTFLETSSRGRSFYLSAVANMDISWNWLDRNFYGFLELYYNGLSEDGYADEYSDPAVLDRIIRGELFVLGSLYASTHMNVEVHPLVQTSLTTIVNIKDGSGILLPRLEYDMSDNLVLILSGAVHWGGHGTEYGGFDIPVLPFSHKPFDSISMQLTWYF